MGKKIHFFIFFIFSFFSILVPCVWARIRQEGGGIRQRGCLAAPQPKRVKRGKNDSPPAGHPSPSGPPQHPHGTRQNNKNESTKKLKRMNHFLKNNMQTCEFVLQNFFSISFTTGSITSCLL